MKRTVIMLALVVAVVAIAAAPAANAEAPSWSYIEAGYLNVDPDDADSAGDNWFAGGNFQIFNNFHLGARYVDGDFGEVGGVDLDFTYWNFVLGWHGLLGEKWDLFAEASWNDIEVGSEGDDLADDTVGANVGIKWRPVPLFEAGGIVRWADYDEFDTDADDFASTSYGVNGIFHFGRFGLGASAEFNDDVTQYTAFARFAFDAK